MAPLVRVRLLTSAGERSVDVLRGATLLRAVLRARLPIGRSCRGQGVCASCRVFVVEGAAHLLPPDPIEAQLAARIPLHAGERYACRAKLDGDATLTTSYW